MTVRTAHGPRRAPGWVLAAATGAVLLCGISEGLLSHERVTTRVTFDREIAPILTRRCLGCHSAQNLAMPLTSYEQARPWARAIEEEVLRLRMPPWRAAGGRFEFANSAALTGRERQLLIGWVEGGGPKTLQQRTVVNVDQLVTPAGERLRAPGGRWASGPADAVMEFAAGSQVTPSGDGARRALAGMAVPSDMLVRALEFKPRDRRAVRAAFFYVEETGQWLGAWTPWSRVTILPAGVAHRVPAGAHIGALVHYRRSVGVNDDGGRLGLYRAAGTTKARTFDIAVTASRAPGESPAPRLAGVSRLTQDVRMLGLWPETPRGTTAVEVSARLPDGSVEVLLLVRDVLLEWPTPYVFASPVMLPKGTEITFVVHGDAPPLRVRLTASVLATHLR